MPRILEPVNLLRRLARGATATLLATSSLCANAAASGAAPPASAPLVLSACRLQQSQGLLALPAECGELRVPEDRSRPGGRRLPLFVARIPAINGQQADDPVFVLAGGPGMGASDFYPNLAGAFAALRRTRDIILVDQRGTGRSSRLGCGAADALDMAEADEARLVAALRECRATLARDHDLRQFTTSVAVADLEAVRAALGYARINLYGSSYGTRVALHYARRYPARTRALVLDGVVPPQVVLGPSLALDAQRAFDRILARCRADEACNGRFPDIGADYAGLREQLHREPVKVALDHPRTGEPMQVSMGPGAFAVVLRLASYSASSAALLPWALHQARHAGQWRPLAALYVMAGTSVSDALAYGMHNSVVCAEDVPRFGGQIDRAALERTFLGASQVDLLQSLCADWPRGPVDADFHQPLQSAVPSLLLSGTADPVTPAAYGDLVAQGLRNAVHIALPDQGHGQLGAPCMDRVVRDFLDLAATPGEIGQLDRRCLEPLRPAAFFLSASGPAP
jgi:pimeloyl-ACP methyl ester carboxylesterase